jgi:cytochrome c-type biogenesis protein CcmE
MAMTRKQRRLTLIAAAGAVLVVAVGLLLFAMSNRLTFFQSPSDIVALAPPATDRIRLGGMVEEGSVVKDPDGTVRFSVTDFSATIPVVYHGLVPDLFAEGKGVVTEGHVGADGIFAADTVLARHDENYMPPEVARSMENAASLPAPATTPVASAAP